MNAVVLKASVAGIIVLMMSQVSAENATLVEPQYPVFKKEYIPPGCANPAGSCFNEFNQKMNLFLSQRKFSEAVKVCDQVARQDTPSVKMPDTYEFCAQNGNIRKMGQLAQYYRSVTKEYDKGFGWAVKGTRQFVEYGDEPGKSYPHPDSSRAWTELCAAYRWGLGTKIDISKAKQACTTASMSDRKTKNLVAQDLASKWLNEMRQDESDFERETEALSEATKEHYLHLEMERIRKMNNMW